MRAVIKSLVVAQAVHCLKKKCNHINQFKSKYLHFSLNIFLFEYFFLCFNLNPWNLEFLQSHIVFFTFLGKIILFPCYWQKDFLRGIYYELIIVALLCFLVLSQGQCCVTVSVAATSVSYSGFPLGLENLHGKNRKTFSIQRILNRQEKSNVIIFSYILMSCILFTIMYQFLVEQKK